MLADRRGRLGLDSREKRAWALYDWANSAFVCTIVTAVFPIYFQEVLAAGLPAAVTTWRYAAATALALGVVAVAGPVLGAWADARGARKRLLAAAVGVGCAATLGLSWAGPGEWREGLVLFVVANAAWAASLVFYDALLPHVAAVGREADRVSSAGYATGYLGGGLLLVIQLAWILRPATFGLADAAAASRLAFASVAVWWLAFSIPLWLRVREPPATGGRAPFAAVRGPFARLAQTLGALRGHRQAFLLLLAVLIYNDGISTVYRMAVFYGREVGLPRAALIGAVVLVQFLGVPCAFLFGHLAGRIGARPAIFLGLAIYAGATLYATFLDSVADFFVLAVLIALVQGGTQALSRSLFARLVPRPRSAEFFGFYALAERAAGILGPAVFAAVVAATGQTRLAVLAVLGFFVAGAAVLARVDVDAGERAARAAETGAPFAGAGPPLAGRA